MSRFIALLLLSLQIAAVQGEEIKGIEAQPLAQALDSWARQTGLQVIYGTDLTKGRKSPGARAGANPREALNQILDGSGLTVTWLNERTASIRAFKTGASSGHADRMHLASVQNVEEKTTSTAVKEESEDAKGVPEILVRGTRSVNADTRRTEDDPQPYVVFDGEEIRRSQATTLEDFFKTRLPMNTVQVTESQDATSYYGTQSTIDLRGLGAGQTLILVDGRRMPGINAGGASFGITQPDINGIPLAAIERIEVLPSTASGIYGGGATGGVINIVMRKDYNGIDLGMTYANASRGDIGSYRVEGNAGFMLPDGKTSLLISASHADAGDLVGNERDLAFRGRMLLFNNNANAFYGLATPPMGYTSNIRSQSGANLVLDNGTALNSPRTFVPIGYAGPASDNGMAFVANAGKYNLLPPNDVNGGLRSLLNTPKMESAAVNLRRPFGSRVEAFTDFSWMNNQGHALGATGATSSVTIPASSSVNPFTTNIIVRYPSPGLAAAMNTGSETLRASGGVIVRLPAQWSGGLDYSWNRSRYTFLTTNPIMTSAAAALQSGALNVMRDVNVMPVDFSPYLLPSPNYAYNADTALRQATVRLTGPVMHLPGGAATLSALAERRDEEALDAFEDFGPGGANYYPGTQQSVDSYYVEADVPLFSSVNAAALAKSLQLQVSMRHDAYTTRAPSPNTAFVPSIDGPLPAITLSTNDVQATKYTLGLRYQPVRDLTLRASYGTGFLAPSVSQIVTDPSRVSSSLTFVDPKRNNQSMTYTNVRLFSGGNPNLKPEDSKSWSAGVIFTPAWLEALRLSVDYTHMNKTDEITEMSFLQAITLEDFIPGRVTRNSAGDVTAVDLSAINMARAKVAAYDIQVDYTLDLQRVGSVQLFLIGTYQRQLARQPTLDVAFIEYAGFIDGPVQKRGNLGFNWDRGGWSVNWNAQYYGSYASYGDSYTQSQRDVVILNQGSDRIPSQMYHDLFIRLRMDGLGTPGWLTGGTEVSLGIQNLFDTYAPPISTSGAAFGYSGYGDPRLRRYSLTLRKHF